VSLTVPLLCPDCGDDSSLCTSEIIAGQAEAGFYVEDGEPKWEHGGYTHVAWDSSTTQQDKDGNAVVDCRNCFWSGSVTALLTPDQWEAKQERG
jgi:hypothetical protein